LKSRSFERSGESHREPSHDRWVSQCGLAFVSSRTKDEALYWYPPEFAQLDKKIEQEHAEFAEDKRREKIDISMMFPTDDFSAYLLCELCVLLFYPLLDFNCPLAAALAVL